MRKKSFVKYYQGNSSFIVAAFKSIFKNTFFLILLITSFAFFIRVFLLDHFPIGITHDELSYVISAKSLFLTGSFPPHMAPAVLPVNMSSNDGLIAEIPALLLTPFIGAIKFSLATSRLPGAVLSSLSVLLIYFLVLRLTKNKFTAIISACLMAINPWSFIMGRTVFEVNFYTFFFLLGFLVLLNNKRWKIIYSLPIYLLGFLSYTGGQVVFYLFIVATVVYHYYTSDKKEIKPYLLYGLTITLILIGYIYLAFHNQTFLVRGGELFLPTNGTVSQEVDKERLLSVPFRFNNFFINKATVYLGNFFEKYLDAFSPVTLFLKGELRAAFSLQKHGNFYLIDSVLILLGIAYLISYNRKVSVLFLFLILISPITSGLSQIEHSYSQRAGLMYPYMIIFTACGITFLIDAFSNKKLKYLIGILLFGVYSALFLNLIHIYFFRFPVYASDGWFFQDRILSKYIEISSVVNNNQNIIVFSSEPKITFEEYLYFTNLYNRETVEMINSRLGSGKYFYENVTFTNSCTANKDGNVDLLIYDDLLNCPIDKKGVLRITRFQDVLEKYLIKNDVLCSQFKLGRYVEMSAYRNFDLNSQSIQEFCTNWITKL